MKGSILKDSRGDLTICMEGGINCESGNNIAQELTELLNDNPYTTIRLDLSKVDFIGSSGICHFVETLKSLNKKAPRPRVKLTNVKDEFARLFKLYKLDPAIYYCDFGMNDDYTKDLNQKFGNRKFTFEN